jgi:hypothetical protein
VSSSGRDRQALHRSAGATAPPSSLSSRWSYVGKRTLGSHMTVLGVPRRVRGPTILAQITVEMRREGDGTLRRRSSTSIRASTETRAAGRSSSRTPAFAANGDPRSGARVSGHAPTSTPVPPLPSSFLVVLVGTKGGHRAAATGVEKEEGEAEASAGVEHACGRGVEQQGDIERTHVEGSHASEMKLMRSTGTVSVFPLLLEKRNRQDSRQESRVPTSYYGGEPDYGYVDSDLLRAHGRAPGEALTEQQRR